MANVSELNEVKPTEKYKSTKMLSGLGGWTLGAWIGTAAATPFVLSGMKDAIKFDNRDTLTKAEAIKPLAKLSTFLILPLLGGIIGAVTGYKRGKKAEAQYDDVNKDLALSQQQVSHLTAAVSEKDQQLVRNEKRFTDVITSRQQIGGHAPAVHAGKHQAAEAEVSL